MKTFIYREDYPEMGSHVKMDEKRIVQIKISEERKGKYITSK